MTEFDKMSRDQGSKLAELDKVMFNKNAGELDIFRDIFVKIAQVESDRKTVEHRIE